jgi:glycerol-1-phosphate dehydrogenase [NAD(P)+]
MAPGIVSERVSAALRMATDTRILRMGEGVLGDTAEVFRNGFGEAPALVVADTNTFRAAGQRVADLLRRAGIATREPFVFDDPDLHARHEHVCRIEEALRPTPAIPVAVGSGTINDLCKLAAHRCGRPYMTVATAASMDGYTAFGASITHEGAKQTFLCPAPRAVIADLEVIGAAPPELNAAGYGDLVAKVTAGADWLLADALGIEPIQPDAWALVQGPLRQWLARPEEIRRGDPAAIGNLTEGLLMTGFAMQVSKSSRPASGAEHQFSHLWDMQDHRCRGRVPLHGVKVAIGTLASTLLYEALFACPVAELDVDAACRQWPEPEELIRQARQTHARPELAAAAARELHAKYVDRPALAGRLRTLKTAWPELRQRLANQLIPSSRLRRMLRRAGAPDEPDRIGIDLERLRRSYVEAQQIRRRFTVLDLAVQTGWMGACLERLFAADGPWRRKQAD